MDPLFAAIGLGVLAIGGIAFGAWFGGKDLRAWDSLSAELGLERRGRARYKELVGSRDEIPLMVKHMILKRDGDERHVSRVITAADLPMAPGLSVTLSPTRHVRVLGVKVTGRYGEDLSQRYAVSCKDSALADAILLNPMVKPTLDALCERRDTAAAVKANTVQITRPFLQAREIPKDIEAAVDLAKHLGLAWKAPFVKLANSTGLPLEKTNDGWAVRGLYEERDVRVTATLIAGRVCVECAVDAPGMPPRLRVSVRGRAPGGTGIEDFPDLRIDGMSQAEAQVLIGHPNLRKPLLDVLGTHSRSELRDGRVILRTGTWPDEGLEPPLRAALRLAEALEELSEDPLLTAPDLAD